MQVAMKNCVDDISIHAVEEQVMQNLPRIFDPGVLEKLADSEIATLAAEKRSSAIDRAHNEEKLANLVKALQELQGLDRHLLRLHGKTLVTPGNEHANAWNASSNRITWNNSKSR